MSKPIDLLRPLVLNVGLSRHEANWNWKNVNSPFMRLFLVMEGNARVHMPDTTLDLSPGHLYFIPAFVTHSYECNGHFTHYYLHLYEEDGNDTRLLNDWQLPYCVDAGELELLLMEELCKDNPELRLPASDPDTYDNSSTLMQNVMLNKSRPLSRKVQSRGAVLILMSRLLQHARPIGTDMDRRIAAAIEYIMEHTREELPVEELAANACMTKDYFIRLFRKHTGQTPQQYIIRKKMERAQLLLITSDAPIKQIAEELGYYDHSYFNRVFRKNVGTTPMLYRTKTNMV